MVLENLCKQTVHRAARRGEEVHDLGAVPRAFESALHGLHLPADAPDTVKQLLLIANGVSHKTLSLICPIPRGGILSESLEDVRKLLLQRFTAGKRRPVVAPVVELSGVLIVGSSRAEDRCSDGSYHAKPTVVELQAARKVTNRRVSSS